MFTGLSEPAFPVGVVLQGLDEGILPKVGPVERGNEDFRISSLYKNQGRDDHIKTKERWGILKEFFNKENIDYREIYSVEGSILSKLINLIYLFDYTSIYRAILSGIDPTPVEAIDFIKNKL